MGLAAITLFFANALVGNPVSKAWARQGAADYINQNYSDLGLKIESVSYNFKIGRYRAHLQSEYSPDTAFSISLNSFGKVKEDDYPYEVANHFTTWRRLSEELRNTAHNMIGSRLEYDMAYCSFDFKEESNGNEDLMKLERDMKLDIFHPPLPLSISIGIYSDDLTYGKIADVAKEAYALTEEQGIPVSTFSIRIIPVSNKPEEENGSSSWVNAISADDFPAERITEENLPQVMEQFEKERVEEYNETHKK